MNLHLTYSFSDWWHVGAEGTLLLYNNKQTSAPPGSDTPYAETRCCLHAACLFILEVSYEQEVGTLSAPPSYSCHSSDLGAAKKDIRVTKWTFSLYSTTDYPVDSLELVPGSARMRELILPDLKRKWYSRVEI